MNDESRPWPPDDWSPLLIEIGRIVYNWNTIENTVKRIFLHVTNNTLKTNEITPTGQIMVAHIPLTTLSGSLRAIVTETISGDLKDHLIHSVELFDRLKDYRNYYIHSFSGIQTRIVKVQTTSGEEVDAWVPGPGTFKTTSARGALKVSTNNITADEARRVSQLLTAANSYLSEVSLFAHLHFSASVVDGPRTPPEKFPLPHKFQRNSPYPPL